LLIRAALDLLTTNNPATVSVVATASNASGTGPTPGVFTFFRDGNTNSALAVHYQVGGTATRLVDYQTPQGDMPDFVIIPAGAASATRVIVPIDNTLVEGPESVILSLSAIDAYHVGSPSSATVTIADKVMCAFLQSSEPRLAL